MPDRDGRQAPAGTSAAISSIATVTSSGTAGRRSPTDTPTLEAQPFPVVLVRAVFFF